MKSLVDRVAKGVREQEGIKTVQVFHVSPKDLDIAKDVVNNTGVLILRSAKGHLVVPGRFDQLVKKALTDAGIKILKSEVKRA